MRRSKAPSVLHKAKRSCNSNNTEEAENWSNPEDEQYAWGSRDVKLKQNKYQEKRIFNVVWRDVSTKKHKTWKGDGTLEVHNNFLKAILKDETGKFLGCSTKFNRSDLVPDFPLVIGSKEIEIQNEIVGEDQLHELCKRQIENCMGEDYDKVEKKPKGGFHFKPILVLNPPKIPSEIKEETHNVNISCRTAEIPKSNLYLQTNFGKSESELCSSNLAISKFQSVFNIGPYREFLCFLRPSELQQFLFHKVLEYISSIRFDLSPDQIQSLAIDHVLQNICNHPSLINHKNTTNKLMRHLIHNLPDWTDMGPFDSCKLEFVQYFLTDLKKLDSQVCTIIAQSLNVLNMLQGLCDFMNIECLRLEGNKTQAIHEFCSSKTTTTRVLLANVDNILENFNFFNCKKFIIFEQVSENLNIQCKLENTKDVIVYNLVTAFSIEELLLFDKYNKDCTENLFDELFNITNVDNDCCYVHFKIGCNCFKSTDGSKNRNNIFTKNWYHFKSPFDVQLLKISSLENSSENILSIFYKKN